MSLALAIGANTTVFSLANALLLRPLPAAHPEELIRVHSSIHGDGFYNISYPEYAYYRDHNRTCAGLVAFFPTITMALNRDAEPETVTGEIVSSNYFAVLGVVPVVGRAFAPEDDQNPAPGVVLAYTLWEHRFGRDPRAVGRSIRLNGQPMTVIGVAPKGFGGTFAALSSEIWVPLGMARAVFPQLGALQNRERRLLMGIGRLRRGVSLAQARADFGMLAGQLRLAYPATNRDHDVQLASATGVHPALARTVRTFFTILLALVSLTLVVACANIASLLLARGAQRVTEFGARRALGATRARLAGQLLTESLVLALLGGGLGLLVALAAVRLLPSLLPVLPFNVAFDFRPDVRVLAYTFALSMIASLAMGVLPAMSGSATEITAALRGSTWERSGIRLLGREVLMTAQVVVSMVLLIAAGLLVRSLQSARLIDPGFATSNVLVGTIDVALLAYSEQRGREFYESLLRRVHELPGVQSASLAAFVPLGGQGDAMTITSDGQRASGELSVGYNVVTPEYFTTLRIPLLYGTGFQRAGSEDAVVVNMAAANRLWPGLPPAECVGKRVRSREDSGLAWRVVGVAPTGKYVSLGDTDRPFIYRAFAGSYRSEMTIHVRAQQGADSGVAPLLRNAVHELDPQLPVSNIGPISGRLGFALTPARVAGSILTAAGMVVLVLTAMGVYAVSSFSVTRRVREIGIRLALGAPRHLLEAGMILHGIRAVLVGIILGVALAAAVTRVLRSLLLGVASNDLLTFAAVACGLLLIAIAGCYVPVRRAVTLKPAQILREQ